MERKIQQAPRKEPQALPLGGDIFELSLPPVGFLAYLVVGDERAALIDTGMGVGSLQAAVGALTEKPVFVLNTHGHPDHAGGNAEFGETYINPADYDVFDRMACLEFRRNDVARMPEGDAFAALLQPTALRPTPLEDGRLFDLGGRSLRVIFAPGHTHGSICVYDESTGSLFAGDNAMRRVGLHEWNSAPVSTYKNTLQKLIDLKPVRIFGGHRPNVNGPEILEALLSCAERALSGEQGEERTVRGVAVHVIESGGVSFDFLPELLR